ncbi:conserved hypothetical protein [Rhodopirellula baltica SH 1]|uniref:Immunity protein Imm33 domain-containing protein n=2 Tax=Rhodopirellula baltica TaxID=265606 RepID=Q7UQQ3_RHOBA|nr:conserved hypothetical protein [Rhodopirellula baltica SH 1]
MPPDFSVKNNAFNTRASVAANATPRPRTLARSPKCCRPSPLPLKSTPVLPHFQACTTPCRPEPRWQTQIMEKSFHLPADAIRPLAVNRGACIATDMITVDGLKVGYMYREDAINDVDSGWRFFSGTETQEYVDDATNSAFYDINTIANYDPDIIDWLGAPIGAAFERLSEGGDIVPVAPDSPSA